MRHLVFSYHTCPLEEPGTALAGGMNIYLRGLVPNLPGETLVLTSGQVFQELRLGPARIWRLPCRGDRWDRPAAEQALPLFVAQCRQRLEGDWDALSAHYWLSARAALELFPERRPLTMLHSLDPGSNPERAEWERRLARECPLVFSSSLDRIVTERRLGTLRPATIARPGCDPAFRRRDQAAARRRLGLPAGARLAGLVARREPSKNAPQARAAARAAGMELVEVPGPRWPQGLPHGEMPWFYAAMDMVLSVSDYETFGLSVLEALAAGCPAAVGPTGYWGGLARHACLVGSLGALPPSPDPRQVARSFNWQRTARRWIQAL